MKDKLKKNLKFQLQINFTHFRDSKSRRLWILSAVVNNKTTNNKIFLLNKLRNWLIIILILLTLNIIKKELKQSIFIKIPNQNKIYIIKLNRIRISKKLKSLIKQTSKKRTPVLKKIDNRLKTIVIDKNIKMSRKILKP